MKHAEEWADEAADAGDYGVRRRIDIVRAIQADALETAAEECDERGFTGCAAAIRRLKPPPSPGR